MKRSFIEPSRRGKVTTKNVLKAYQRFVLKGMKFKGLDQLKIVADSGNGMAGILLPLLEEKTPLQFTKLFEKLDGRFPNRGSDPTLRQNQRALAKEIKTATTILVFLLMGTLTALPFLMKKETSSIVLLSAH